MKEKYFQSLMIVLTILILVLSYLNKDLIGFVGGITLLVGELILIIWYYSFSTYDIKLIAYDPPVKKGEIITNSYGQSYLVVDRKTLTHGVYEYKLRKIKK